MTRLTSRSREAGRRSVITWPMPIITYQLTTSTPGGGNALWKPCLSSCAFNSFNGRDWSCLKKTVSRTALSAVGAALPCGGEVWAIVADVSASAPARHATIVHVSRAGLIANSFQFSCLLLLPVALSEASEDRSETCGRRTHFRA